jgi:sugar-specific transcriptional regulator TrmB
MTTRDTVRSLGLSDNSSRIYLTCLEQGSGTVTEIAKKAGIRRTTAYRLLTELAEDGLVEEDATSTLKRFTAKPPEQLIKMLEEKKAQAEQLLPALNKLFSQPSNKPNIRFYSGIKGIKHVFEDSLTSKEKVIYTFSPLTEFLKTFGNTYSRHYMQKRIDLGIERRSLRPFKPGKISSQEWEFFAADPRMKRQIRQLPDSLSFHTPIQLYDDKIAIMDLDRQYGFILENPELSSFLKGIFNLLWENAQN